MQLRRTYLWTFRICLTVLSAEEEPENLMAPRFCKTTTVTWKDTGKVPFAGFKEAPVTQGWEIFENQWGGAHPQQLLGFVLRRCLTNSSLLGFPLEEGSRGER